MRWQLQWNPDQPSVSVELLRRDKDLYIFKVDGNEISINFREHYPFSIRCEQVNLSLESWTAERWRGISDDKIFDIQNLSTGGLSSSQSKEIRSQMPGRILRLSAKVGESVKKGAPLIVIEAMKMENEVRAQQDCTIKNILVTEGQSIESNALLIELGDKVE